MIGALVSLVTGLGGQWLSNRQKIEDAKAERAIRRLEQDGTIAENLTKGFKDELWTITVLAPIWVGMYAVLWGDDAMLERVLRIPDLLSAYVDPWVWGAVLMLSAVVSFGGRATDVLDRIGWKRGNN